MGGGKFPRRRSGGGSNGVEGQTMKCLRCGSEKSEKRRESHGLVGLPGIILVGVWVERCLDCGEYEVEIPRHSRLMEVVTRGILNKRGRLVGMEIRWLRGELEMTGVELARHVGVSGESVSKWERDQMKQSPPVDLLLRMLVGRRLGEGVFPEEALPLVSTEEREPLRMRLRFDEGDWKMEGGSEKGVVSDPTQAVWVPLSL